MSLIKKKDVESYLSARRHRGIHAIPMAAKPAKTALSASDLAAAKARKSGFASDFSREHSSPGGAVTAVVMITPSGDSQTPGKSSTSQV
jgi:hypothetical protein